MNILEINENELLQEIAKRAEVAEGSEAVRDVLLNIYRDNTIKNKKLSQLTEIPVPVLAAIRGELKKAAILEDKTNFTTEGKKFLEQKLGFSYSSSPIDDSFIDNFSVHTFPETILSTNTINQLQLLLNKRPDPDVTLDQSMATFETQLKRLLLLLKNGDIEGRKILFLGDDDATSLVISATKLAKQITVLDIDERILDYVNSSSKALKGTTINTIKFDLREPLPKEFQKCFDVVFTDPPYTFQGGRLFFERGKYALQTEGTKFYFSFGPKEPIVIWNLQLLINNAGFSIWKIHRSFNKYIGNLRLGQFSNMYVLKMVQTPSLLAYHVPQRHNEKIYTSEVRKEEQQENIDIYNGNSKNKSIGYHVITEFYNLQNEIISKPNELHVNILELSKKIQLTVVDSFIHIYKPYGISIIIVLAESHIGIHTWPEHDYMSVDVFICDEPRKAHLFIDELRLLLKPVKVEQLVINRGVESNLGKE